MGPVWVATRALGLHEKSGAEGFRVDVLVPGEKISGVKPVLSSFKPLADVVLTAVQRLARAAEALPVHGRGTRHFPAMLTVTR